MQYGPDTIPVCPICASSDSNAEKQCSKCGIAFCTHFASETDVRFCGNCMADFSVKYETEIRTVETTSANEIVYRKRDICTRLKLEGTDWLFTAQKISTLSDEELDATIEYHRAIASAMLHEREARRVEKYQHLQKTIVKMQHDSNRDSTGALKGSAKTPKERAEDEAFKKEKKVKKVSTKSVSSDKVADALAVLLKGFTPEQLAVMIGGKK